jgi:hypothetical protein
MLVAETQATNATMAKISIVFRMVAKILQAAGFVSICGERFS